MDQSTGALQVPSYTQISRADHCPLLKHAWGQNWEEVVKVCAKEPWRTLHMTQYSGRTALHLATFDRSCPLKVARALLKANRQMIAVRDSNNYTPLHIVAFFSAATTLSQNESTESSSDERFFSTREAVLMNQMGRTIEEDGRDGNIQSPVTRATNDANTESEAISVMSLFCDTAIMVEQELGRAMGKNREEQQMQLLEGTSPLYLAAKKGAPVSILKILLETRSRTNWIAPSTGGEPYWYRNNSTEGNGTGREQESPNASFSSPLEILLREDRLRSSMNASYYRNDAFLLGEEEDGNILRRGRTRSSSSIIAASRCCDMSARARRSPLHPDELDGAPHLRQEMRRMAIGRCWDHFCRGKIEEQNQTVGISRQPHVANGDSVTSTTAVFTEAQQRCLELWKKCIELLVTAGGGGIPLLMTEDDEDIDETTNHKGGNFVLYGILHACVCCKVPVPSLVEIALILFPEQVFKRDKTYGVTPLQHVLRAKHKYSYAKSYVPTILLKDRANTSTPISSKNTRTAKKHLQKQFSTETAKNVGAKITGLAELPSLSYCTTYNNGDDKSEILPSHWPSPRYLQSTVLLPFPCMATNNIAKGRNEEEMRGFKGPIPLIFAIRLGLPMDGVINKLLEADSHESLRTLDPISQLPPFALVAMRVCSSNLDEQVPKKASFGVEKSHDSNREDGTIAAMMSTTTARTRNEHSTDIITAAIGSTINVLSSGDGNSEFEMFSFSSSSISTNTRRSPPKDNFTGPQHVYKMDDIYRLLLAHPQVLAQYTTD